jgi:hypothetical protein
LPFFISQPIKVSKLIIPIKGTKRMSIFNKHLSVKIRALKRPITILLVS